MGKRRRLSENQPVYIIYIKQIGFIKEIAEFVGYRYIDVNGFKHESPIFKCKFGEVTGLDCFWVLKNELGSEENLLNLQYEIIKTQIDVLILSQQLGYNMPHKLTDLKMQKIAQDSVQQTSAIIAKFGFDPRDTSWIDELGSSKREKNWFKYERENSLLPDNWEDIVNDFNKLYFDSITIQEAKALYKKRMRYILGSYNTRMSGNKDKNAWGQAAIEFENKHRSREERMYKWSIARKNNFPTAITLKPIKFWHGPYFNQCIENIPNYFTNKECSEIKEGIDLRIISYDPLLKYIRLDFNEEISNLIRPSTNEPWIKDDADYDIWVNPDEINSYIKINGDLE